MQVRGYLNTSTRAFTRGLDSSAITWPTPLTAGEDIVIKFQLSQEVAGFIERLDLPVASIKARIGTVKTAAEAGDYILEITYLGTTVTTTAIAWDATAAQIKTIIDTALGVPLAALNPCTVTAETGGAYRIVFKDNLAADFAVTDNSLWPLAFVNAEEQAHDEGWVYILSHQQTPVAETVTLGTRAPDMPVVTRKQAGSDTDGILINEIQKLVIPPSFAGGTFQLSRSGVKSGLLPLPLSINAVADAIAITADEGGIYRVTASSNAFFIEFMGTMAATGQDLFEVVPFDVPSSDYYIKLSTKTAAMAARMRRRAAATGEVVLPLHLTLQVENEIDDETTDRYDFSFPLTFTLPPGDDEHNVSTDLNWAQPPSRLDVLPHSPNSVLVGHRSYRKAIGNGSATDFSIDHNLSENPQAVTPNATTNLFTATDHNFFNGDAVTFSSTTSVPAPLVAGTTYWIVSRTDDTFQVSLLQGGTAIDLTDVGSGTITARIDDGPGDGFHVVVYEREGDRARIPDNAYTVELTSDDALTISGFAVTPTANQYIVHVTKIGRVATYQALELPIARVIGLQAFIDATNARLAALEILAPGTGILARRSVGGRMVRPLLPVAQLVRAPRELPADFVFPETLLGWQPYTLYPDILAGRILPAVHDAATEALPAWPAAVSSSHAGKVFSTAGAVPSFPGGGLRAGDFAACDGREWYRVALETAGQSSYYPSAFDVELFRIAVNEYQLTTSSLAELLVGFELAYYPDSRNVRDRRTAVSWTFKLEFGTPSSASSPGTPGLNLDTFFASPLLALERRLYVTEEASQHKFGVIVERDSAGDLEATAISYLKEIAAANNPAGANFAIRGRLCRLDPEDPTIDPRGLLAIRGLDVGLDGLPDTSLGKLIIS